jgi:hypothetical protein
MARIDVEVDVDDMLWDMNRFEKQEMVDKLYRDGYTPVELQDELDGVIDRQPVGYNETELHELLNRVWDNRKFITEEHKDILRILSKKGI